MCCAFLVVIAQEKIQVIDNVFNTPMEGVNVSFDKKGTTTDSDGSFTLKTFSSLKETDSLNFSFTGYSTKKIPISELKKEGYIVYMLPIEKPLKEVTVISNKTDLQEGIQFKELASMKEDAFAFGAVVANNKIYISGGDNSKKDPYRDLYYWEHNGNKLEIYDIESNSWHISDAKFTSRAYHNIHYYNGKIYILGGKKLATNPKLEYLNGDIEVYDIQNDTVFTSKINPHSAVNFASAIYKDNIIVMGGSIKKNFDRKVYTNKAHLFNLKTGYWYELDNIPYSKETKGIIVDSILYQIGGFAHKPLTDINSYNINTGEYKLEKELPVALERPALACNNNTIYIFENGSILTYEVQNKKLYTYKIDLNLRYSEMVYQNGLLYIIGGQYYNDELSIPSNKLYSIDLKEFKKTKSDLITDFQ